MAKCAGVPFQAISTADAFEMLFTKVTCSRLAKHESVGVMGFVSFALNQLLTQGFDFLPELLFLPACRRLALFNGPFSLAEFGLQKGELRLELRAHPLRVIPKRVDGLGP
jgi:hypothetical protein